MSSENFTIGVEEEYQIIDPVTRKLRAAQEGILPKARRALGDEVQPELYLSQIEAASPICHTLGEVREQLIRLRREVITAAEAVGSRIGAAGTHPFSHWQDQEVTPKERYLGIEAGYQQLARENVIFGCHVHIGLNDKEAALEVLNRVRVWLTPLLALAANSPFWLGDDTGYACFRTELWTRWPMAGPPHLFGSRAEYDALIRALVETGSVEDASKIYWDVRLPERVSTIEFRITDVCLTVDEAVMIAGLVRALVLTCYEQAQRNEEFPRVRQELLRAAHWRAARYGLSSELIDLNANRSRPAHEIIESFMQFVRPSLEATDDFLTISQLVEETLQHGNGAMRQYAVYQRNGQLNDVVDFVVQETARDIV
ncbi:MAG: carboxylate-amine ligase [Abitibacteriaceae bacterium]|nr:carboxylate-amine ligase [Abditibacteriaceae bacterium]